MPHEGVSMEPGMMQCQSITAILVNLRRLAFLYFFIQCDAEKEIKEKNSHGPRNRVAKTGPGSVICREHHLKSRNVGILCNPFSMYLQISEEKTTRNPRVNNG